MVGKSCISNENLQWFIDLLNQNPGYKMFLEIGTYDGLTISMLAKQFPDRLFTVVDDFSEGSLDNFQLNNEGNENVILYKKESSEFLDKFRVMFDIIFIDGLHTYHAVKSDFLGSWEILKPSGILVFHDRTHPEVRKAIEEVCIYIEREFHIFDEFLGWVIK